MRSRSASARKAGALNSGRMMRVPQQATIDRVLATMPVTCARGAAAIDRSASVSAKQYWKTSAELMRLRCVSIAPLGRPVVPDV